MTEPSGHCPYLGLKQNRAIRFASPTPEHRCYVSGDPQEIPVDQATRCLSSGHVQCPLYMGLPAPTTLPPSLAPLPLPRQGLVGWLGGLSLRDRVIYGVLLALLVTIVGIYAVAGAQLLSSALGQDLLPTVAPAPVATTAAPSVTPAPSLTTTVTPAPSSTPALSSTPAPSPTAITMPTLSPTAVASLTPTDAPFIPFPDPPTYAPLDTPIPADTATLPPADTATADATGVPATPADATATPEPPTSAPTDTPPPQPTDTPPPQPTEAPPSQPTDTPPQPTEAPAPTSPGFSPVPATLYFADARVGSLYVPVRRAVRADDGRVAEAVVRALVAGPRARSGLAPVANGAARLLGTRIDGDMLLVDFDRSPGDDRAFYALALSLTELPGVARVQVLERGVPAYPSGAVGPLTRPLLNPDNPAGHSTAYSSGTRFLPLFFRYNGYHVRVTRLVGRTGDVAAATARELLAGPSLSYGGLLESFIPAGVELRGLQLRGDQAVVNLSAAFASAAERRAAVDQLVLSLTELRGSGGERRVASVVVLVEGQGLGDLWGAEFAGPFARPAVNAE